MNEQQSENGPVFRLEKLYVKDLSFESPNTPEAFFIKDQQPSVEMNLKMNNKMLDDHRFEVCLEISATITDANSDKTLLIVEIEHAGAFLLKTSRKSMLSRS